MPMVQWVKRVQKVLLVMMGLLDEMELWVKGVIVVSLAPQDFLVLRVFQAPQGQLELQGIQDKEVNQVHEAQ